MSDKDAEPSVLTITDCNGADSSSNYYVDEDGALVFDDGSYAWQEAYIAASEKNALAGGRITGATAGAISVGDYNELYLTNVNIMTTRAAMAQVLSLRSTPPPCWTAASSRATA